MIGTQCVNEGQKVGGRYSVGRQAIDVVEAKKDQEGRLLGKTAYVLAKVSEVVCW